MKDIIFEAGYLITYLFCELDKIKTINPILCKYDYHNNKFTKEFRGPFEKSIPEVVDALEESEKEYAKAFGIFPADIKEEGRGVYSSLVLIARDFISEKKLILTFPYEFNKNKLYISSYEVIESLNLDTDELNELNLIFIKGALSFKECLYLWQDRFLKEDSLI